MKVMISQPMKGKTNEQIREERRKVVERLIESGHEVVDTIISEKPPEAVDETIFYLSKSIEFIGKVDVVYFMKGWENARGCKIEYEVCMKYGKPLMFNVYEDDTKFYDINKIDINKKYFFKRVDLRKENEELRKEVEDLKNKLKEKICFEGHAQVQGLREENEKLKAIIQEYNAYEVDNENDTIVIANKKYFDKGFFKDRFIDREKIDEVISHFENIKNEYEAMGHTYCEEYKKAIYSSALLQSIFKMKQAKNFTKVCEAINKKMK